MNVDGTTSNENPRGIIDSDKTDSGTPQYNQSPDFCSTSPEPQPSYDSDDDEKESISSISDSGSDSSVLSTSSDLSSPVTCIPWTEKNQEIIPLDENQPTMETYSSALLIDRKRKERHESSCSQEQDSKVIRATEPEITVGTINNTEDCVPNDITTMVVVTPDEIQTKCVNKFDTNQDYGKSIPILHSQVDRGMRMMPMNFEPEIQRQWERTAAQWHSRKLRKSHHRPRHHGRSSKSFSDAEDVIRSNYCNLEELSISNSKSSSISVSPTGQEENFEGELQELETSSLEENEDTFKKSNVTFTPLPLLDLSTLHHQMESEEPISYGIRSRRSSEQVMLSPRNSITVTTEGIDTIPPSPPVNQFPMDPPISRQILEGNQEFKINTLSRQIGNWKKQLKGLEEEYMKLLGYRPSHADKINHREMRKCLLHISKAKQELKQIREDPSSVSGVKDGVLSSVNTISMTADLLRRLAVTVTEVEENLLENRQVLCRPEDPILMNPSELMIEKSVMQKQLVMLEKRHGRPVTKDEKDIVRKLYDRYRVIKKMSSRFTTVKENSLDLVPILEHETLELQNEEIGECSKVTAVVEIKRSPRSHRRRFGRSTMPGSGDRVEEVDQNQSLRNEDYNEMDLNELERHYKMTSDEKRKLRLILRASESDPQGPTSARLQQRDEKYPVEMEMIYHKYKHTRATLRLLDVLINKRKYPNLLKDIGGKIED